MKDYDLWLDGPDEDQYYDAFDEEITELLDEPDVEAENYSLWSDYAADKAEDKWRQKYDY